MIFRIAESVKRLSKQVDRPAPHYFIDQQNRFIPQYKMPIQQAEFTQLIRVGKKMPRGIAMG